MCCSVCAALYMLKYAMQCVLLCLKTSCHTQVSLHWNEDGSVQSPVLALTAGQHALFVSASHGLEASETAAMRADVASSDGDASVLVHHVAQLHHTCAPGNAACKPNPTIRMRIEHPALEQSKPKPNSNSNPDADSNSTSSSSMLGPLEHMRLPTSLARCHSFFRILARASTVGAGGQGTGTEHVCLEELVMFAQGDPEWIVDVGPATISVSSKVGGRDKDKVYDKKPGAGALGGEATAFCWDSQQMTVADEWVEIQFPAQMCVAGYGVLNSALQPCLTDWDLQGSDDGANWTTIDRQRSHVWTHRQWKKFSLPHQRSEHYLFANGLTDGMTHLTDQDEGGLATSSRVYRLNDPLLPPANSWQVHQYVGGGGAHAASHFVIGLEHFLAVLRSRTSAGPDAVSEILRWDGEALVADYALPVGWSSAAAYFEAGASHYLAVSDHGTRSPFTAADVVVLRYGGAAGGWQMVQRITHPSSTSIHDLQVFSGGGSLYLASAYASFTLLCQGVYSCMQPGVFECGAGNLTQLIRFHDAGSLVADSGSAHGLLRGCRWILAPPGASNVTLTVEEDSAPSQLGILSVHSCSDASCSSMTAVASIVSGVGASEGAVSGASGVMVVEFEAIRATVQCSGGCDCDAAAGELSGVVTDGPGDYGNFLDSNPCTWIISVDQRFKAAGISLTFEGAVAIQSPNTTSGTLTDALRISKCQSDCNTWDYVYSGVNASADGQVLTTDTGTMKIQFTSDSSLSYGGFRAVWKLGAGSSAEPLRLRFASVVSPTPGFLALYRWTLPDALFQPVGASVEVGAVAAASVASVAGNMDGDGMMVAVDLEHFVMEGISYLAAASVASASPNAAPADSLIYKVRCSVCCSVCCRVLTCVAECCRVLPCDEV